MPAGARPRPKGKSPTLTLKQGRRKGLPSSGLRPVPTPPTHPTSPLPPVGGCPRAGCGGSCRRVGRMWGWGQLKRQSPQLSSSFLPSPHPFIRPPRVTCLQPRHPGTLSPFPRKDIIGIYEHSPCSFIFFISLLPSAPGCKSLHALSPSLLQVPTTNLTRERPL